MVGSNSYTISRISPDGVYYGMETDIGSQFLLLMSYGFLLFQLHMSYFPRKCRSKTVEVSFCGIAIKHHMPEWYGIHCQVLHSLQVKLVLRVTQEK